MRREPQSLKDSFDRLLAQPPSSRTRRELESNAKWVCDCLAKGTLQPTAFAGQLEGVFAYIGASREAGLITVLQRLVLLLCESAAQPLTLSLQVVPVCMRALTLLVGKGAWSGVAGCVSILHRAILPSGRGGVRRRCGGGDALRVDGGPVLPAVHGAVHRGLQQ